MITITASAVRQEAACTTNNPVQSTQPRAAGVDILITWESYETGECLALLADDPGFAHRGASRQEKSSVREGLRPPRRVAFGLPEKALQSRRVQQPGQHRFSRSPPGCDRAPADSPEAPGYVAPVTRSLPAPLLAAMAWSTVWWMPKTFVSPVIRKIFSSRSCVQTRSSEPSCARTRFRPPTSTPRPVESTNSTLSRLMTSW